MYIQNFKIGDKVTGKYNCIVYKGIVRNIEKEYLYVNITEEYDEEEKEFTEGDSNWQCHYYNKFWRCADGCDDGKYILSHLKDGLITIQEAKKYKATIEQLNERIC